MSHRKSTRPSATWGVLAALLCLYCATAAPVRSQEHLAPSDARLIEALKSFIPFVMQQGGPPGLNLALTRHGEVIWVFALISSLSATIPERYKLGVPSFGNASVQGIRR